MSGKLYLVSTPIGNLGDISLRAIEVLKSVDLVLAEDTRRTQPLLYHLGITKPLMAFFEHTKPARVQKIIQRLVTGEEMALVSDGGTPTLSDPGARLVDLAWENEIEIIPVPGASALLSALVSAGFPTEPLHFWGFLPLKNGKRKRIYEQIVNLAGCHAFYESPYKLLKHFAEWKDYFSDYQFFVAKEITKKFESFWRGTYEEVLAQLQNSTIKGEYTVLLCREKLKHKK